MKTRVFGFLFLALGACGRAGGTDDGVAGTADITSVPPASTRDQKETGNCWLYATVAWAQTLEWQALVHDGRANASDPSTRPPPFSIAFYDYWDWHDRITSGVLKKKVTSDDLDAGGSWGSAVELMTKHGLMRASDFGAVGVTAEADLISAASAEMAKSLTSGALADLATRSDTAAVRRELDRVFKVRGDVAESALTTDEIDVIAPHPDGTSEVVTLTQAIGTRVPGDNPDLRSGPFAWTDVVYAPSSAADVRPYFQRIQRALQANVPLPVGWFFPDNIDPNDTGQFRSVPSAPGTPDDSVEHETLIVDYAAEDVPGYGKLAAGAPATKEEQEAALDPAAKVTFLRVEDSDDVVHRKSLRTSKDLYFEFLTASARTCPNRDPKSPKCETHKTVLLDVTFPAGF
jgi:hypothetical protein